MSDSDTLKRWTYGLIIAASFGVVVANIWWSPPLASANDRSRWATVRALLTTGSFEIDEVIQNPEWDTVDKVRHDGHFYSSKPPILAVGFAGATWSVERLTGLSLVNDHPFVIPLTLLLVHGLGWVIGLWVLVRILNRHAKWEGTRVALLVTAALGTYLTIYTGTLNNHLPAAFCVLLSLDGFMRLLQKPKTPADVDRITETEQDRIAGSGVDFLQAGFFGGLAACFDMPAALFGLGIGLVSLKRNPKKALLLMLPAALVPVAAFLYLNYHATGEWKPMYAYFGTEKYEYVHDGVPSYWSEPQGLDRSTEPWPTYLLHCTVGHHGILSLTPVFAFTALTWLCVPVWNRRGWRAVVLLSFLLTAGVLTFYLTRTASYNYGGSTAGLRWMFWLIPLWIVTLIPLLDAASESVSFRSLFVLLLAVSVASVTWNFARAWHPSWLYHLLVMQDVVAYSDPEPPGLPEPRRCWLMHLPPKGTDEPVRVIWKSVSPDGSRTTLTLEWLPASGDASEPERLVLTVDEDGTTLQATLPVDRTAFADGDFPTDADLGSLPDGFDPFWLIGLPERETFTGDKTEYRFTPLRKDAFHVQRVRGAAWVSGSDPEAYTQCELWRTPDVPFGVLDVTWTTRDGGTHAILSRKVFRLVEASPLGRERPLFPDGDD